MGIEIKSTSPKMPDVAYMDVLEGEGHTSSHIGKLTGFDTKTVKRYLNSDVYRDDPEFDVIYKLIQENEVRDLTLIGAKARTHLHTLLDAEDCKIRPIEAVAIMDRSHTQRSLLTGKATQNIDVLGLIETTEEREARIKALKGQLKEAV